MEFVCDWKENPEIVIEMVNELLRVKGLKFEEIPTQDDCFQFRLVEV